MGWGFGPRIGIVWRLQQESSIYCLTLVSLELTFTFFWFRLGVLKKKCSDICQNSKEDFIREYCNGEAGRRGSTANTAKAAGAYSQERG